MIAVDWGTSNFRTYRLDNKGEIIDRHSSAMGLLHVPPEQFADVLRQEVHPWLAQGEATILLCGMVGSRTGWAEAPYVSCPASVNDLAHGMVEVPFEGARVRIVPGVQCTTAHGIPEIMRGEETAIVGSVNQLGDTGLVCLPGTHSKWAFVNNERLQSFTTAMTGEVFAALRQHTILSQFMPGKSQHDANAFQQGVEHSAQPGGLLHHLFRVRTMPLTGALSKESTASFLSGLLIGNEVRTMLPQATPVLLLGDNALCNLYATAIQLCGGKATLGGADTAAHGLFLLAKMMDGKEAQT